MISIFKATYFSNLVLVIFYHISFVRIFELTKLNYLLADLHFILNQISKKF